MTYVITLDPTLLTYLGLLIVWFILPSVLDIKTIMADPKKRNHIGWAFYASMVSLPLLITLLGLSFIEKILIWLVKIIQTIALRLSKVINK